MKDINCGELKDLEKYMPALDPGFLERQEFRDFYKFVFNFSKEEETHKTIEKGVITSLLPIVLDNNRAPHLAKFLEFLETYPQDSR